VTEFEVVTDVRRQQSGRLRRADSERSGRSRPSVLANYSFYGGYRRL